MTKQNNLVTNLMPFTQEETIHRLGEHSTYETGQHSSRVILGKSEYLGKR